MSLRKLRLILLGMAVTGLASAAPPPHPFAADSAWPLGFGNTYNQQSTPLQGPLPGDALRVDFIGRDARGLLPSGLTYSAAYAPGVHVTYGTNAREIWKIVRTPDALTKADHRVERVWRAGSGVQFTSGYWLPDGGSGAYFLIADEIVHIVDAVPGDPNSPMAEAGRLSLAPVLSASRRGRLRDLDVPLGFARGYSGALIFTTTRGKVCAVAPDLAPDTLSCTSVTTAPDERVRNSIAIEPAPDGDRVYVTTSQAILALDYNAAGRSFRTDWREPLADSGTSPTLMGTRPGEPQLLVVTTFPERPSAATPYELIALRRGAPQAGQSRVADRIAIDFGLPPEARGALKPTQNSVPVHGLTTVVANFNGIFTYAEPAPDTALGAQAFVFDPATSRWQVLWTNRAVYFPNSMLAIGGTGTPEPVVYGIGLRGMALAKAPARRRLRLRQPSGEDAPVWTLEALSLVDGRTLAQWDIGTGPQWNLNGSGVQIGPDREILTSGARGVYRLKPVP